MEQQPIQKQMKTVLVFDELNSYKLLKVMSKVLLGYLLLSC